MSPADVSTTFPIGLAVLLVATAGVGALLLLAGNRVLLASLGLIGGIGGALVGWILMDLMLPAAPAWVGAVALGALGAILMALSARLVMALLLALVLGGAGWLTVASAERHGLIDIGPRTAAIAPPGATAQVDAVEDAAGVDEPTLREAVEMRLARMTLAFRAPQFEHHLHSTTSFLGAAFEDVRRQWTETPPALRTLMIASAGMCAFLGLCLGLVAPKFTASGITAAFGATMLVLCAVVALQPFVGGPTVDGDPAVVLPGGVQVWLGGWALLTLSGAVIQTARKPKSATARATPE